SYGRPGLRDRDSAQRASVRGSVLRKACHPLRSQVLGQSGLSAACLRSHSPRAPPPRGVRLDSDSKPTGFTMNEDHSKKRLGRGLAALIGDMDRPAARDDRQPVAPAAVADGRVPIEFVSPNPKNPRRNFSEADLVDLAQSIREHGIVQPVLVRRRPEGKYEIIAGERRWRAAQRAGLTEIPVLVRDVDDRTALELAIIENVQRADLNPVEEALGYQQLI